MFYILEAGEAKLEPDVVKWAEWMKNTDKTLTNCGIEEGVIVSTVFLGIESTHLPKSSAIPPLLWETSISLKCPCCDEINWVVKDRYTNSRDARLGHKDVVAEALHEAWHRNEKRKKVKVKVYTHKKKLGA